MTSRLIAACQAVGAANTYWAARAAGAIHTAHLTIPVSGMPAQTGIQKLWASSEIDTVDG
jgi:hypothetical protein